MELADGRDLELGSGAKACAGRVYVRSTRIESDIVGNVKMFQDVTCAGADVEHTIGRHWSDHLFDHESPHPFSPDRALGNPVDRAQ